MARKAPLVHNNNYMDWREAVFFSYGRGMTIPPKLYKYCPINVYSMRAISECQVHYTMPTNFNDPLDCAPTLLPDIGNDQMAALLEAMLSAKMDATQVKSQMDFAYKVFVDPDPAEKQNQIRMNLHRAIMLHLANEFGSRGVLSLSTTFKEPLMWSHYGDQHRGICIEYDTNDCKRENVQAVLYPGNRDIRCNDLYQWKVHNSVEARERVFHTFYYSKALHWKYESEWRDLNPVAGPMESPFKLTGLYFGMRADDAWRNAIVKSLVHDQGINLFDMKPNSDSFDLEPVPVEREQIEKRPIRKRLVESIAEFSKPMIDTNEVKQVAEALQSSSPAKDVLMGFVTLGAAMSGHTVAQERVLAAFNAGLNSKS